MAETYIKTVTTETVAELMNRYGSSDMWREGYPPTWTKLSPSRRPGEVKNQSSGHLWVVRPGGGTSPTMGAS